MRSFLLLIFISCFDCCVAQPVTNSAGSALRTSLFAMFDFLDDDQTIDRPDSLKRLGLYNKLRSVIKEEPKAVSNYMLIYQLGKNLDYTQAAELISLIDSSLRHSSSRALADVVLKRLSVTETGKPFPMLILKDTSGNELSLSSLKGKVVLLDVWSSWCGPCRVQIPDLKKIYDKYNSKDFEIIGISMDDDKEKWLSAIEKDKQTWKQYCELKNWRINKFAVRFHTFAIPANYLIDENGILVGQDLSPASISMWLAQHLK
jgi:thiol-disulfide isomerase/thioredoxin